MTSYAAAPPPPPAAAGSPPPPPPPPPAPPAPPAPPPPPPAPPAPPIVAPAAPALPSLPSAAARHTGAPGGPIAATPTTRFDQMLDEVRRNPPPSPASRRKPKGARLLKILLVGVLVSVGLAAYRAYERRERIEAVPTFAEDYPLPTSYWMSFEGRTSEGLPYSYRTQRSPGSDSIVIETETGFAELNGSTLLVSAEGTWLFDRQSGAVTLVYDADPTFWAVYDNESELRGFGDIVTDGLRQHTMLLDTTEPSTRSAPAGRELTDLRMTIDLGTFRADDPNAFEAWTAMMALVGEGTTSSDFVPTSSTGDLFQLEMTVDQHGLVWSIRMLQDGSLVMAAEVDELSTDAFIPPDPTP